MISDQTLWPPDQTDKHFSTSKHRDNDADSCTTDFFHRTSEPKELAWMENRALVNYAWTQRCCRSCTRHLLKLKIKSGWQIKQPVAHLSSAEEWKLWSAATQSSRLFLQSPHSYHRFTVDPKRWERCVRDSQRGGRYSTTESMCNNKPRGAEWK